VRLKYVLFIAAIIAMTTYSCKEGGGKFIDQGEIHYNIDYVGEFGVPTEFLPKNLVISFKKDKILYEMTGFANAGILNLTNPEKNIYDTYFSLPPVKYYYAGKQGEIYPGFSTMENMVIKKTSRTADICGYKCKNAEVTFLSGKTSLYNVWYTDEIKIKNPNASTPFNQLEGIPLSFFFFIGNSEMHFNAEVVYQKEIPDETFDRKLNFKRISKEDITSLINRLGNL